MTKQQAQALAAQILADHILACRRESDALQRRAAHAARMGDDRRAIAFAFLAKQFENRAAFWES